MASHLKSPLLYVCHDVAIVLSFTRQSARCDVDDPRTHRAGEIIPKMALLRNALFEFDRKQVRTERTVFVFISYLFLKTSLQSGLRPR